MINYNALIIKLLHFTKVPCSGGCSMSSSTWCATWHQLIWLERGTGSVEVNRFDSGMLHKKSLLMTQALSFTNVP